MFASPRDANTVFATFNNYQRGDYKPYVMKSADRGRTWTSITGDLPQRSGAWSIVQDHVNGNLLFAGIEFGVWFTVDGGQHWMQLKGGHAHDPGARPRGPASARATCVVASFGRGAFVLDDYSALRELTPQALTEPGRVFPLRDAYLFDELPQAEAAWGNLATPNPAYGALITYSVAQAPAADTKLVLTFTNDAGREVRRMELPRDGGLHRVVWNLRGDPPAPGLDGGRGGRGAEPVARQAEDNDEDEQEQDQPQGFGRGQTLGPAVPAGRYRVALARVAGATVTPLGAPQSFAVIPLPR